MPARDHRLRERRLKLGLSQSEVGYLIPGVVPSSAQTIVSVTERSGRDRGHRVRRALIWVETEVRRERAAEREERRAALATTVALAAWPIPEREAVLVDRMVDLLHSGRTEEFDALVPLVGEALARKAGDRYIDECTPQIPA